MLRAALVVCLAAPLLAQSQWRRFAPTTDFDPGWPIAIGAVAYEPNSGYAYFAGTTGTS